MIPPFFPEREDESAIHNHELTTCGGALTEKECLKALKDMGTEKTPETDGLTAEFYSLGMIYLPSLLEH